MITVVYAIVDRNTIAPSVVEGSIVWVSYERGEFAVKIRANLFGRGYRPERALVVIDNATGLEISPFSIKCSYISRIFNEAGLSIVDRSEK